MKQYYREYAYTKIPVGKYKGNFLKDVPVDYLNWAVSSWSNKDLISAIRIELHRREHQASTVR